MDSVRRGPLLWPSGPYCWPLTDVRLKLEDNVIEVVEGKGGKRRLNGRGRVPNVLVMELLEEGQELDLLLDLGGEFKYRLRAPGLQGGKRSPRA